MTTKNTNIEREKPFTRGYVLRTTMKHMQRSVDMSIRKTFDRTREFETNSAKSTEAFEALSFLHTMRKMLEDFKAAHPEAFKDA